MRDDRRPRGCGKDALLQIVVAVEIGQLLGHSHEGPRAIVAELDRHQRGRKAKYLEDPLNDKGVQREALAVLAGAMGEDLGG